ncbi:MAG: SGNH/GDSL hydrolase family protein [Planctomycetaceae bacterium]
MPSDPVSTDSRHSKRLLVIVAALMFAVVVGGTTVLSTQLGLPNYGAWTGNQPYETKLELLANYARQGEVDAFVFGSSIVDYGVSAESLSQLISQESGAEFRAFNLGTGAAEPRTIPKLYRLARTVVKPKSILVVHPAELRLSNENSPAGPDFAISRSPAGAALSSDWELQVNRWQWQLPIVRNAPALRDLLLYTRLENFRSVGGQPYPLNQYGDRVCYRLPWEPEHLARHSIGYLSSLRLSPHTERHDAARQESLLKDHFSQTDIDAIRELRQLAAADGVPIILVGTGPASMLTQGMGDNRRFRQARRDFYEAMATELGARFVDPAEEMQLPLADAFDQVHLNVYGARKFSQAMASALLGKPELAEFAPTQLPPQGLFPTNDRSFSNFASRVERPAQLGPSLLRIRMFQSRLTENLPTEGLQVALRLPDGRDIVRPAYSVGPYDYVIDVDLPAETMSQSLVMRLVSQHGDKLYAINHALTDFEWLTGFPQLTPFSNLDRARTLVAWPPERQAGQTLFVGTTPNSPWPKEMQVELVADKGDATSLGVHALSGGPLVSLSLPKNLAAGRYRVRLRDDASGQIVDESQQLTMLPGPPRVELDGVADATSGQLQVTWTGICKPKSDDWIGLFPAGGTDTDRMTVQFLGGAAEGQLKVLIPPRFAQKVHTGEYELRLFAAGGWTRLATSEPFSFAAPPAAAVRTASFETSAERN